MYSTSLSALHRKNSIIFNFQFICEVDLFLSVSLSVCQLYCNWDSLFLNDHFLINVQYNYELGEYFHRKLLTMKIKILLHKTISWSLTTYIDVIKITLYESSLPVFKGKVLKRRNFEVEGLMVKGKSLVWVGQLIRINEHRLTSDYISQPQHHRRVGRVKNKMEYNIIY